MSDTHVNVSRSPWNQGLEVSLSGSESINVVSWNHRWRVLESTRANQGRGPGSSEGRSAEAELPGQQAPCGSVSFPELCFSGLNSVPSLRYPCFLKTEILSMPLPLTVDVLLLR